MYALEMFALLNRFRCLALMAELAEREKEQDNSKEDRAGSAERDEAKERYVKEGMRRIAEFERRANGKA